MVKKRIHASPLSPEDATRMFSVMDHAVHEFKGQLDELESAIGMYVLGRHVGWKVLYLVHSKKTIAKYEQILGITVREEFPEIGPEADRSLAFNAVQAVSNFWKVVSGAHKLPISREERRSIS
ncbi:hypothetical protein GALL_271520 [mine drainage metagenome]|uniref:Uncharacterized protein n=1 Tax=mine drainage metagenome TaxID=410659 RepID=A0A1J5RN74_9ZZZZ